MYVLSVAPFMLQWQKLPSLDISNYFTGVWLNGNHFVLENQTYSQWKDEILYNLSYLTAPEYNNVMCLTAPVL